MDHNKEKWTQYFLSNKQVNFLRNLRTNERLIQFGEIAIVNVGIVTGRNAFFLVDREIIKKYELDGYLLKLVGRTKQFQKYFFTYEDWKKNYDGNLSVNLLNLPKLPMHEFSSLIQKYINLGEEKGYHLGFKTRQRKPWYFVPSIWAPDAFLYRQIHDFPRMIQNDLAAECTDTIHRVKFNIPNNHKFLSLIFHNSITLAFSEITGRSYGGGVLELEPRESLELYYPNYKMLDFSKLNIKNIPISINGLDMVDYIDQKILIEQLGFSHETIDNCHSIWEKLSKRRRNRK